MIGCKLRIPPYDSVDYAMHLPLMLCEPLGGDFDGDQLSAYLVPEEIADETMKLMSPRYVTKYKKNL